VPPPPPARQAGIPSQRWRQRRRAGTALP